jgi:hypothetical protein
MINIIEPRSKNGKRYNLCDNMVDEFLKFDNCFYIGKIGMRMMARPHAKELKGIFIEPVWTFRKNSNEYIKQHNNSLESFFV